MNSNYQGRNDTGLSRNRNHINTYNNNNNNSNNNNNNNNNGSIMYQSPFNSVQQQMNQQHFQQYMMQQQIYQQQMMMQSYILYSQQQPAYCFAQQVPIISPHNPMPNFPNIYTQPFYDSHNPFIHQSQPIVYTVPTSVNKISSSNVSNVGSVGNTSGRTQIKKTKTITKTEQVNVTDTSTTTIKEDTIELKSESLESNDSHESIVINTTTTVTTKKNVDNVDWESLSENPEIFKFEYDYERMKYNMDIIGLRDELMSRVFDPERLKLMSKNYKLGIRELIQIYS